VVQRFATEGIEIPYPRREVSSPGEGSAFEGPGASSEPRP
jgi:small-conductance mechanosensitive channel